MISSESSRLSEAGLGRKCAPTHGPKTSRNEIRDMIYELRFLFLCRSMLELKSTRHVSVFL
jgi:hypothetical protein